MIDKTKFEYLDSFISELRDSFIEIIQDGSIDLYDRWNFFLEYNEILGNKRVVDREFDHYLEGTEEDEMSALTMTDIASEEDKEELMERLMAKNIYSVYKS